MNKRYLLLAALLFGVAATLRATTVNPTPGLSSWTLASRLGLVVDATDGTPLSDADAVGGVITISTADTYFLKENITSRIVIDVDNVCLNLNCRSITGNWSEPHITVNQSKKNIWIGNGALFRSTSGGVGIKLMPSVNKVEIESIRISGSFDQGIYCAGQNGSEVTRSHVARCDIINATIGVSLEHADRNNFTACRVIGAIDSGYALSNAERNYFQDCCALSTYGTGTVEGFVSNSGQGNLFERCVVKNTKTESWEFCNKSYGFLLTGTESKTKIIDCIVNETDMTSTVSAIAYGIHLDPTLLDSSELLVPVTDYSLSGTVYSVAWSPDESYLSTGGTGNNFEFFFFDGESLLRLNFGLDIITSTVHAVDWSPNGKYVATGDWGSPARVRVFSFDGASVAQTAVNSETTNIVLSVAWSPSGRYLADGEGDGNIRVYDFDGSSLVQITNVNPGDTSDYTPSVAWSPDGNYLAASSNNGSVRVYQFTGTGLVLLDDQDYTAGTEAVWSIAWSPDGMHIVAGAYDQTLRVIAFDGQNLNPVASDSYLSVNFASVAWSPNGKHVVAGDAVDSVHVFSFDGTSLNFQKTVNDPGDSVEGVDWSPSGLYVATVSESYDLHVFDAMYGPQGCLIKGNTVCDAISYGQFVGTGIMTGGSNCVVKNCCYNNEVNYSYGIPHIQHADQNDPILPQDNISVPPF